MTADDGVFIDPTITSGHRVRVQGTSSSVVHVLRHLAVNNGDAELLADSTKWVTAPYLRVTPPGIRAALAYAARVCRAGAVSLPATEAFLREREALSLSRAVAREAKDWAARVLEQLSEGKTGDEILRAFPDPDPGLLRAALWWGAAAVYDESARAAGLSAEPERFLRDLLSEDDQEIVHDYYVYVNATGMRVLTVTPEREVTSWGNFVSAVEQGYGDYDEYTRELSERDILASAIDLVTPASRRAAERCVSPLDDRFLAATVSSRVAIHGRHRWLPHRWWWFRVPTRLVGGMERELRERAASPSDTGQSA